MTQIQSIIDEKYSNLPLKEKTELYILLQNKDTQQELRKKIESIIFKIHPPTPEEFLNPSTGWLSRKVTESIFPHIKKEFISILNGDKNGEPYNKVVQYGGTRLGKSFLARLLIIYTIIFFHCLRDPAMYYGLSPLTELCIYLVSFKYDKIRQVYLRPIYNILSNSKRFIRVDKQDQVIKNQEKLGNEVIVWCKSATTGFITLASGLQIQLGNDESLAFIGADVVMAFISELAYFIEYAGATEESIYRLYTDLFARIQATVKNGFLAFVFLDTSANLSESLIEKHIIKELRYREGVYFNWQSRWEARPDLYPKWKKTGKTFKVITGNGDIPAKIINDERELVNVPQDIIIDVPIDLKQEFEDNLIRSIKDAAGRPTSNENKLITDIKHIDNLFSNDRLINIEGIILADAKDFPEKLIWNQISHLFFTKNASGKYIFKRAPDERRYVGIDNAFSVKGDIMGIACLHKEWDLNKKQSIYITDFNFPIGPKETGINLEAPIQFLIDMRLLANVYVYGVFTDTFQSQDQIQHLERFEIKAIKQSVDESLNPYLVYLTCLINESLKSGKNIFLKNNLQSLIRTRGKNKKEIIDHTNGTTYNKYDGDWKHSTCGLFAKDVSDAHCQAFYGAYNDPYIPTAVYQLEEKKFSLKTEDILDLTKDAFKKLHKNY